VPYRVVKCASAGNFLQLKQNGPDPARGRSIEHRGNAHSGGFLAQASLKFEPSPSVAPPSIRARQQELAVEIDANGSSWALAPSACSLRDSLMGLGRQSRRILIGHASMWRPPSSENQGAAKRRLALCLR